ncbi:DUF6777 domain-containing protein [Streptomyces sp. NPDC059862]|uniref:DUF6777 domain-containing protein n=1 Tax=Streptomyces sp. NPDC059862 TaxID=3346975 RepID=UPI00365B1BD6
MTFRVYMRRAGKSVFRRIAVLLVFVVVLSGCDRGAPLFAVKAVAAGVPSLAPFFDESAGLGHDAGLRSRPAPGGLQQGDTPGLYGGTGEQRICDVARLKEFLTDPRNHRKAQAWATVLDITTAGIPDYLDRLTPVLLRTDTLVKNHDYKKGKSVPFDALLQAGIAVLVDPQGLPAVKCSCGNPLRPFEGDTGRISVRFEDGNQKWKGYDRDSVVAVQPAPRTLDRLALVDVDDPDRGISRPVGTTGDDDSAFDTRERRAVPDLAGTTFGRASRLLTDAGLAVAFDGGGLPPDGARVMASDPPAGTELRFGEYVTLSVADGTSGVATTPPDPSPATSQPTGDPSSDTSTPSPSTPSSSASPPSSSAPTSEPPTGDPPTSEPPVTDPPTSAPPTSRPPSSAPPPSSPAPTSTAPPTSEPPPETSAPPEVTSSPPPSDPVPSSAPVSSEPGTVEPTASATT